MGKIHACRRNTVITLIFSCNSLGVYGVPKQWCAQDYANAVYAYSRDHGRNTSLKEIHFVDVSDEMLFEINKAFRHTFKEGSQIERRGSYKNGGTIASSSKYDVLKRETDNGGRAKYCQNQYPKWYSKENKYIIELSNVLKVMIYTDDVTTFKAGVICCSQDAQLGSAGRVASAIRELAGPSLEASLEDQKLKRSSVGDIVVTEPGKMRCASIFHVISPDFKALAAQSVSDAFLSQVERGYFNCLQEANQRGVQKIAIPLFGCGKLLLCNSCCIRCDLGVRFVSLFIIPAIYPYVHTSRRSEPRRLSQT